MEVIVAENAGFCFGVKRAVKMAFDAAEVETGEVRSLGPLIHNPQEVARLAEKGVVQVETLEQVKGGTVILRSHGVSSPQIIEDANAKGLNVIDATCPFVTNAQRYAKQLVDEGYQVIMVGDRNHPEAQSVAGHAGGEILITESFEEIKKYLNRFSKKRIGIISQTTQTYETFSGLVVQCLQICEEVKVFNTICYATEDRQTEAQEMAGTVDAFVVVGGKNSANTTHLADICREKGVRVFHVETADEVIEEWFLDVQRVGVTAGASTPDWLIQDVISCLKKI